MPSDADVVLYHIGNDPEAHGWILDLLRRHPGVVMLHELVLHHLIAGVTLGRGDGDAYVRALQREHGLAGRLLAHAVIEGSVPPLWEESPERFPLVGEVLPHATGLIVHSRYVERSVRERGYAGPVWRIPHPAWPTGASPKTDLFGSRRPVIGCFGHLNARKRLGTLLDAFVLLRRTHPDALLVLAGSVAERVGLDARLSHHGLAAGRDVACEGHVDEARLWQLLAASDVCVNLRYPTMGETSGMVLRALSCGKAVVVNDVGPFSELPSSVVAKLQVDEREAETLAAFLARLADDGALRERMGAAAREYVRREHDLATVADRYAAALEEAGGGSRVRDAVLGEVARAAHDVGFGATDPEIGVLADRIREAGIT